MLPLALACDAVLTDTGEMIGDPTEGALVVLAEKGGLDLEMTRAQLPARRRAAVRHGLQADGHVPPHGRRGRQAGGPLLRQGRAGPAARARLLAPGPAAWRGPASTPSSAQRYLAENERLALQGLRVMATARKDFDPASFDPDADLLTLMDGLTLLALVGIVDPPRPAAKAAIAHAHSAGIQVRMITGDHAVTAQAIARELGIKGRAISGAQFAELSDEQADAEIDDIGVIARVTPEQKVRLVDILKRKGHVVGMTGDGVNDAPALKRADIGIAMGITGTEVSKEAAAMILTDDNFATIVKAVELGRRLYDNLVKYIRFQMGALAGMIVTFLGASILNIVSGIPFLPMQTLWVNFTTQVFQAIGLGYGETERRADGAQAAQARAADPAPRRHALVRRRRPGDGDRHARGGRLGRARARRGRRPHDGADDVLDRRTCCSRSRRATSCTSIFSLDTFNDRTFLKASLLSVAAIILATELGFLQRVLDTVELTGNQWLICIGAGADRGRRVGAAGS